MPKLTNSQVAIIVAIIAALATIIAAYLSIGPVPEKLDDLPEVSYTGRVIEDNKSETPIRGAEVALECRGVPSINRTDNRGIYLFKIRLVKPLDCRVRVAVANYQNYDLQITIHPDQTGLDDIRLTPVTP